MKALVLGEESLRKAVPAIAHFVHFRRRKHMNIRERNELDPRWRHCVKTRKLSAGSRQGQGEGLGAIAKEITAGNKIALVKIVVNLGYSTTQVVKRGTNYRRVRATATGKIGRGPGMLGQQGLNHRVAGLARSDRAVGSIAHRHARKGHDAHVFALALIVAKEKRFVFHNRPTQRPTELVIVECRV